MSRYRTRTGVVLTSICGEFVLIAAKAIRDQVGSFAQLSESSAFLWRLFEPGASTSEAEKALMEEYEIEDPAIAGAAVKAFVQQMTENGFLLKEGENNEE